MRPVITVVDHIRLTALVSGQTSAVSRRSPGLEALRKRLGEAAIVEPADIAGDRITMNSRVVLRYANTNEERTVRLVFPSGAQRSFGSDAAVSVLSPVGAAILGARRGETVEWNAPAGEMRGETVDILYQPEAAGDPD